MPKFHVSMVRGVARREVLEVSADTAEEARWIALSSCDAWMDLDNDAVTVTPAEAVASKVVALKSAA
ncbi:conserved protein of unknown function [Magnetospirillum sp. XM-1]|uniref:hypothetical protein n=1 Tax=Magnetospirillum sp. XM-1 TaxID=1663591 RepID=UPI00073DE538|nr:hypothetical protein [Magnetospirillum sp. XM-1]CUW41220.1 conserved protein of unknown function [Magnetospirillum sp. XM-1]